MPQTEEEVDTRLPYRVGCPKLPVLPVKTDVQSGDLDRCIPNFAYHAREIQGLLSKYDIPLLGLYFAHRMNDGIEATDRYLTLVLLSQYTHDCQSQWIQAVKEVRIGLGNAGINYTIELIDMQAFLAPLRTLPILSTDRDIIEGWNKILPDCLATIADRAWVAIDVVHRKIPPDQTQPTVVISAQDANEDTWWVSTLPTLRRLLQANNLTMDIVLLFHKGPNITIASSSKPQNKSTPHYSLEGSFYDDVLQMGTSCGTSGSPFSGTLGGGIKLQNESIILELGLTNYHVLREAFADQHLSVGPFSPSTGHPYETVVSPSDSDHTSTVQRLEVSEEDTEDRIKQISQSLENLAQDDPKWKTMDAKRKLVYLEQETLRQRRKITETSRDIGNVYAASGFGICKNQRYGIEDSKDWALDWCLVQMDPLKSISRSLKDLTWRTVYNRPRTEVTEYCSISPMKNHAVLKRGRTTGWTKGIISAIDSVVNVQDQPNFLPKVPTHQRTLMRRKWKETVAFVHAIFGTSEVPQFMEAGDSGSLVLLDRSPQSSRVSIIGLSFAANNATYASYMMPMDLIVENIEAVTGGKVIEPRNGGSVEDPE
ncbi:hypothetical protein K491DRAFT_717172 [Lophiostoma macrostomum CBS 122681]|uniref:Uncharacterized protein n=1 Tax=Lophiostoma macrostomum CBS 122681 TaxID=1314788 RepID=A0A6A6T612_9PLEO|nr:hypothetical protein K491DRAFT_717172 [Lophiostoma macrostomum CBS 122681]